MSALDKYDVKGLQAKLGSLRTERQEVEKSLEHMRGRPRILGTAPRDANFQMRGRDGFAPRGGGGGGGGNLLNRLGPARGASSPPRRGGLASRLGPPSGRQQQWGGGRGGGGDGAYPRKRGEVARPSQEDEPPRKKRLMSAVTVPGKEDDAEKDKEGVEAEEAMAVQEDEEGGGEKENKEKEDKKATAGDDEGWGEESGDEKEEAPTRTASHGGEEGGQRHGRRGPRWQEEELKAEERGQVREIYLKADVQQRNRRMFGALMGHLGQAKARLNKDEVGGGIIAKQNSVLASVLDKDKNESEKIKQRLRESRIKARGKEERKRAEITLKEGVVEKQLELARFATCLLQCNNFIRTKAEPAVYFLPAQLSDSAKALLTASREETDKRIKEKEEETKAAIEEMQAEFKRRWPEEEEGEEEDKGKQQDGVGAQEEEEEGGEDGTSGKANGGHQEEEEEEVREKDEEEEEEEAADASMDED